MACVPARQRNAHHSYPHLELQQDLGICWCPVPEVSPARGEAPPTRGPSSAGQPARMQMARADYGAADANACWCAPSRDICFRHSPSRKEG